ncbi:MAG: hypothetical protein ACRDSZ_17685 [Pseudonocardiaceae bacterium]
MPPLRRCGLAILVHVPPLIVAGISIVLLYRSSRLHPVEAERPFVLGLLLGLAAVGFVVSRQARARARRDLEFEDQIAKIRAELHQLRQENERLREDVHSRIAIQEWLEIFDRVDAHTAAGWIHLNREHH